MSRTRRRLPMDPVLRSSSLRQALIPMLLLWLLLGGGIWIFAQKARVGSLDEMAPGLEEALDHRTERVAESWWQDLLGLDAGLEPDWSLATPGTAAQVYLRAVEQRLVRAEDPAERRALRVRRLLLEPDRALDVEISHRALVSFSWAALEILAEEVPERFQGELEHLVESRFLELEEELAHEGDEISAFWGELRAPEAVEILSAQRFGEDEDEGEEEEALCWLVVDEEDERLAGNVEEVRQLEEVREGRFLFSARLEEEDSSLRCLVREIELGDDSVLLLGVELVEKEPLLLARNLLLLLGFLVALAGAYWLASRPAHFVRDLERARKRLEDGDSMPRLRRARDGSDFDRAAFEINTILARLDGALVTLTQVTDDIAHDLRTPLTRLQGQLDLLRRSREPTEEMIAAVQEEADQLLATFNALLRIAQVESGSRKKGFRSFDLRRVVEDVADLYAPVLADHGLAFRCRTPAGALEIFGDPDLWMQALSNLLDNALKYTPKEGSIGLSLTGGGAPRIQIQDSGPGIPESEQQKVFQRFYRMDQHRGERGSGLGLSLVAAICELHGATIRLRNDGGLVVSIELVGGRTELEE